MYGMFSGCSGLTSLDLSNFDTSNIKEMDSMFANCSSLKTLELSNFDTSRVFRLDNMFMGCTNLTTLDLSGFNTTGVLTFRHMFKDCNELRTLILGDKFNDIPEEAHLINGRCWIDTSYPSYIISGDGEYAVFDNHFISTYIRADDNLQTYPTNIKVEYSAKYHQVRFTWDKVEYADRYGIAVYMAGKWRVQTKNITDTVYTSPKNLTSGKKYRVATVARVYGRWDTANAIKNAVTVTVK